MNCTIWPAKRQYFLRFHTFSIKYTRPSKSRVQQALSLKILSGLVLQSFIKVDFHSVNCVWLKTCTKTNDVSALTWYIHKKKAFTIPSCDPFYFLFLISSPGSSIIPAFCSPSLSKDDMRSANQIHS